MDEQHAFAERLQELEVKAAYQDDTIDQLNHAISQQQVLIDTLEYKLKLLTDKLKSVPVSDIMSAEDEPPPPHY